MKIYASIVLNIIILSVCSSSYAQSNFNHAQIWFSMSEWDRAYFVAMYIEGVNEGVLFGCAEAEMECGLPENDCWKASPDYTETDPNEIAREITIFYQDANNSTIPPFELVELADDKLKGLYKSSDIVSWREFLKELSEDDDLPGPMDLVTR